MQLFLRLILRAFLSFLLLSSFPAAASEPILARLSFWVASARMAEFEKEYATALVPLLEKHDLRESSQPGRATPDSIFTRLFEFSSVAEFAERTGALGENSAYIAQLRRLGRRFGTVRSDSMLVTFFELYQQPAGSGQPLQAGRERGHWRTYDASNGLNNVTVYHLLEDRNGNLWIGTIGGGISRYDGSNFQNFTVEDGLAGNWVTAILEDRNGNLWFATDAGLSRYDGRQDVGQSFRTFTIEHGLASNRIQSMLEDRDGNLWVGTNAGLSRYDSRQEGDQHDVGQSFHTFTIEHGLADDSIQSIFEDRKGNLWFGSLGGASLYIARQEVGRQEVGRQEVDRQEVDRQEVGETFHTFTTQDGLVGNTVIAILEDRDGNLLFGTNAGVSRFDGNTFHTFTSREGLPSNEITASVQDQNGHIWFTTRTGHVIRYDARQNGDRQEGDRQDVGNTFHTFTEADGLGGKVAWAAREDRQGNLWLARTNQLLGGLGEVIRYDGHRVTTFTMADGLVPHVVSILEDSQGRLWFGGGYGVSLYDARQNVARQNVARQNVARQNVGGTFEFFPLEKGLVWSILEDRQGDLWFGCAGGVSRYDGQTIHSITAPDGSLRNVRTIAEDRDGNLWFGTDGAGAICYDGRTFQSLNKEDGLAGNVIRSITEDRDGDLWFGYSGGITRFHKPDPSPPPVVIDAVVADRRHENPDSLSLSTGLGVIAFEFHGLSARTRPGALVYQYRLSGHNDTWKTTSRTRVEYEDLPLGSYTFEVEAIDRDLVYSARPARLPVTVHPPYATIALACATGIALFGVLLASGYALKQRQQRSRAERALMRELEEELQTAHDMQMSLMPEHAPQIPGVEIVGRCLSANHVGGDFFQYFQPQGRLSICLADVTGHAMEAAIPAVMFDGILKTEMRAAPSLEQLFVNLNQTLSELLRDNTFICFTLGEFDPSSLRIRLSNGGCPYPYHFRASTGELSEVRLDAYPLGIRSDTRYPVEEIQLEPRDYILFCSDGIVEAENPTGDQFGFDQTEETIRRGCTEGLSPEQLIDRIFSTVDKFADTAPQGDDRTVVVLKIDPSVA